MHRRAFLITTVAFTAASTRAAHAVTKRYRIGWLTAQREESLAPFVSVFRDALKALGYAEGTNLDIDFRYGNDAVSAVPALAHELEQLPVDLLVVQGEAVPVVHGLRLATPVVYVFSGDPVSAGFADSLSRPRANMTGLTFMAAELNGKRLEILQEIVPQLRHVALVANPEHPGENLEREYSEKAARRLGLSNDYYPTRTREELSVALKRMAAQPPQAISLFADGFAIQNRRAIIDFGLPRHIPVISGWPIFAQAGAICSYGPRLSDSYRRLAYYVDRVLRGAKPADLPIERPTTFELVINARSAKALGLALNPTLLALADEVIE